jgi:uncharacterized protein (UPF0332 family)
LTKKGVVGEINKMIAKGEKCLKAANLLLTEDFPEKASAQAYYAVFHLMQAALLIKGLSFSKHSGVLSAFSQYFIKEGIFPKDFARDIRNLRKDREIGDYGYTVGINKEEAREDIENAQEIVTEIKNYLTKTD